MSGLEVAALVPAIVSAAVAVYDKYRDWRNRARARKDQAQNEELQQSLQQNGPLIQSEYDTDLQRIGQRFKTGDEIVLSTLKDILINVQGIQITLLSGNKHDDPSPVSHPNHSSVLNDSLSARKNAIMALAQHYQRLLQAAPIHRPLGAGTPSPLPPGYPSLLPPGYPSSTPSGYPPSTSPGYPSGYPPGYPHPPPLPAGPPPWLQPGPSAVSYPVHSPGPPSCYPSDPRLADPRHPRYRHHSPGPSVYETWHEERDSIVMSAGERSWHGGRLEFDRRYSGRAPPYFSGECDHRPRW
ncbi:hypothetical protein CMUS01_12710 [Colletotrichum musicola]|uniref:Uncharacterized protein n=1 Tax=Colletotrichum musicola TaxID=2175873 RepID=A0A8H6JK53_9PEZI|nr:hypothetical protein CMUS01_12710 [Colletotrichum musicola]